VKTAEGPQNTSSSRVTPVKIDTLFSILTPLPILTFSPMNTF
jgi:hypothetical protein